MSYSVLNSLYKFTITSFLTLSSTMSTTTLRSYLFDNQNKLYAILAIEDVGCTLS